MVLGLLNKKNPAIAGFFLFLAFLKHFALSRFWIVLFVFKLSLNFLTVFAGKVHRVRLGGLELYEMVLRHIGATLPES